MIKNLLACTLILLLIWTSCRKNDDNIQEPVKQDTTKKDTSSIQVTTLDPQIPDDYSALQDIANCKLWGTYNVHDPTGIKFGDYYYVYNTDVMYGYGKLPVYGIPYRRSKDLVHFEFKGWVFRDIPNLAKEYFQTASVQDVGGIWAPYIMKYKDELRLYFSVASNQITTSVIGLATASSPEGPWKERGTVVTSNSKSGKNAIDPTVVINDETGEQWLAYGSCWSGITMLKLDPSTGLPLTPGDKGVTIVSRSGISPAGCSVGNLEGADIIYNPTLKKYFIFVSYDWLSDKYNVRVGRADKPEGPYYDYFDQDLAFPIDHVPILTHAYKFNNHSGWQGVGHCGILQDGNNFYMLHQGRLVSNAALMDLHIRQIVWNSGGWPSVSPERYVPVPKTQLSSDSITGLWEEIVLDPGSSFLLGPKIIEYLPDFSIKNTTSSSWQFNDEVLKINKGDGQPEFEVKVLNSWDWERNRLTLVYTGINSLGYSVWGKKLPY